MTNKVGQKKHMIHEEWIICRTRIMELPEIVLNSGARNKAAAHTRLDPGTRIHCCRCSLPGLAGFTISRREEIGRATINFVLRERPFSSISAIAPALLYLPTSMSVARLHGTCASMHIGILHPFLGFEPLNNNLIQGR